MNSRDLALSSTYVFGTPFWNIKKELPQNAHKWALEYKKNNPSDVKISNVGGYHSPPSVNFNEILHLNHIQETLEFLPKFKFDNWWLNVQKKGDYNNLHTHPLTDLSVIWYITDNHGTLHFDSPFQHTRHKLNLRLNTPNVIKVTSTPGEFIIFPSDLYHKVNPHKFRSPRISLSMNLILL
tara:strand:+ start:126 stop:668 length:543 start_codon:yes stop_codon:yes gene_type:complete